MFPLWMIPSVLRKVLSRSCECFVSCGGRRHRSIWILSHTPPSTVYESPGNTTLHARSKQSSNLQNPTGGETRKEMRYVGAIFTRLPGTVYPPLRHHRQLQINPHPPPVMPTHVHGLRVRKLPPAHTKHMDPWTHIMQ